MSFAPGGPAGAPRVGGTYGYANVVDNLMGVAGSFEPQSLGESNHPNGANQKPFLNNYDAPRPIYADDLRGMQWTSHPLGPEMHRGINSLMRIVIFQGLVKNQEFIYTIILPIKRFEGALSFQWDTLVYGAHMMNPVPEEAAPDLMTSRYGTDQAHFERVGLGYAFEAVFQTSQEGRMHAKNSSTQLQISLRNYLHVRGLAALLNARNYMFEFRKQYGFIVSSTQIQQNVEHIIALEIGDFGILQKEAHGFNKLLKRVKAAMEEFGTVPTALILTSNMEFYTVNCRKEYIDYFVAGPNGNMDLRKQTLADVLPGLNLATFIARPHPVKPDAMPVHMLRRARTCGEYATMCEHYENHPGYKSFWRTIQIYNQNEDRFENIDLKKALLNSRRFDCTTGKLSEEHTILANTLISTDGLDIVEGGAGNIWGMNGSSALLRDGSGFGKTTRPSIFDMDSCTTLSHAPMSFNSMAAYSGVTEDNCTTTVTGVPKNKLQDVMLYWEPKHGSTGGASQSGTYHVVTLIGDMELEHFPHSGLKLGGESIRSAIFDTSNGGCDISVCADFLDGIALMKEISATAVPDQWWTMLLVTNYERFISAVAEGSVRIKVDSDFGTLTIPTATEWRSLESRIDKINGLIPTAQELKKDLKDNRLPSLPYGFGNYRGMRYLAEQDNKSLDDDSFRREMVFARNVYRRAAKFMRAFNMLYERVVTLVGPNAWTDANKNFSFNTEVLGGDMDSKNVFFDNLVRPASGNIFLRWPALSSDDEIKDAFNPDKNPGLVSIVAAAVVQDQDGGIKTTLITDLYSARLNAFSSQFDAFMAELESKPTVVASPRLSPVEASEYAKNKQTLKTTLTKFMGADWSNGKQFLTKAVFAAVQNALTWASLAKTVKQSAEKFSSTSVTNTYIDRLVKQWVSIFIPAKTGNNPNPQYDAETSKLVGSLTQAVSSPGVVLSDPEETKKKVIVTFARSLEQTPRQALYTPVGENGYTWLLNRLRSKGAPDAEGIIANFRKVASEYKTDASSEGPLGVQQISTLIDKASGSSSSASGDEDSSESVSVEAKTAGASIRDAAVVASAADLEAVWEAHIKDVIRSEMASHGTTISNESIRTDEPANNPKNERRKRYDSLKLTEDQLMQMANTLIFSTPLTHPIDARPFDSVWAFISDVSSVHGLKPLTNKAVERPFSQQRVRGTGASATHMSIGNGQANGSWRRVGARGGPSVYIPNAVRDPAYTSLHRESLQDEVGTVWADEMRQRIRDFQRQSTTSSSAGYGFNTNKRQKTGKSNFFGEEEDTWNMDESMQEDGMHPTFSSRTFSSAGRHPQQQSTGGHGMSSGYGSGMSGSYNSAGSTQSYMQDIGARGAGNGPPFFAQDTYGPGGDFNDPTLDLVPVDAGDTFISIFQSRNMRARFILTERETDDITRVLMHVYYALSVNLITLLRLVDSNVRIPFCFTLERPAIHHEMDSMILCVPGAELGATLIGHSIYSEGDDPRVQNSVGSFTIYTRAVVTDHRKLHVVRDAMFTRYLSGNDTTFIERDDQFKPDGVHRASIICKLHPFSSRSFKTYLPIKGDFSSTAFPDIVFSRRPAPDQPSHHSVRFYSQLYRNYSDNMESGTFGPFVMRYPTQNDIVVQGAQRNFNPLTGAFDILVDNKGHCGATYVGCAKFRNGDPQSVPLVITDPTVKQMQLVS